MQQMLFMQKLHGVYDLQRHIHDLLRGKRVRHSLSRQFAFLQEHFHVGVAVEGIQKEGFGVILYGHPKDTQDVLVRQGVHGHPFLQEQRNLYLRRMVRYRFHQHFFFYTVFVSVGTAVYSSERSF